MERVERDIYGLEQGYAVKEIFLHKSTRVCLIRFIPKSGVTPDHLHAAPHSHNTYMT